MATASTRTLWKGAISFGLVHIPIALHSAIEDTRPKMRMIDATTGAAVGYRKVDKATGEAVEASEVTKGVEVGQGQYVTLTKEEIREALPRTTQTIEIESFVRQHDVPTVFYNKPYYVSPINKGRKVYALLRDVLRRTGRVGLGRIVVSSKQHLALVVPHGDGLVVNLLRWNDEVRDIGGLPLPGDGASEGISERELKMGEQLVLELADEWHPERFRDEFKEKLEQLVEQKRAAGVVTVAPEAQVETTASADVVDLTELLRRSLQSAPAAASKPAAKPAKSAGTRVPATQAANDEVPARASERPRRAAAAKGPAKSRATAKASPARGKGG